VYYAKQIDENGNVISIQSMSVPFPAVDGFVPITEEEFVELMTEYEKTDEISDSEALAIITGGAV
jgi:hypothetical protein